MIGLVEAFVVARISRHYGKRQEILSSKPLVAFAQARLRLPFSIIQLERRVRVLDTRQLQQADDRPRMSGSPFLRGGNQKHIRLIVPIKKLLSASMPLTHRLELVAASIGHQRQEEVPGLHGVSA